MATNEVITSHRDRVRAGDPTAVRLELEQGLLAIAAAARQLSIQFVEQSGVFGATHLIEREAERLYTLLDRRPTAEEARAAQDRADADGAYTKVTAIKPASPAAPDDHRAQGASAANTLDEVASLVQLVFTAAEYQGADTSTDIAAVCNIIHEKLKEASEALAWVDGQPRAEQPTSATALTPAGPAPSIDELRTGDELEEMLAASDATDSAAQDPAPIATDTPVQTAAERAKVRLGVLRDIVTEASHLANLGQTDTEDPWTTLSAIERIANEAHGILHGTTWDTVAEALQDRQS